MLHPECRSRHRHLLAAACLALATAIFIPPAAAQPGDGASLAPETVLDYARWAQDALEQPPEGVRILDGLAERLETLANEQREENEVAPLAPEPGLERAARAHALDMLERDYVDHLGPRGLDVGDRVGILHRTFVGGAGENIGEQTGLTVDQLEPQLGPLASTIIEGFMESPGHRENLLEVHHTHHGMAAAGEGERLVQVHVFGARRALLREAPPLEMQQGDKIALEFETGEGLEMPARYGYAQPGLAEQTIVPLELTAGEVTVDPGVWRLQFFFPTETEGMYEIVPGPIIVVR